MGLISRHWKKNFKTKFEAIQASREWNELFVSERKLLPILCCMLSRWCRATECPAPAGKGGGGRPILLKPLWHMNHPTVIFTQDVIIYTHTTHFLYGQRVASPSIYHISSYFILRYRKIIFIVTNILPSPRESEPPGDRKRMFDVAQSHVLTETTS